MPDIAMPMELPQNLIIALREMEASQSAPVEAAIAITTDVATHGSS
jgi:hypothetical protein